MDIIADFLKEAREEAGIDLKEVSKDLNIDELILKNIEDGKIGAFKDIFVLKEYVSLYAKYLGLNSSQIANDFNEYLFEYTSKIPVEQIEKEIKQNNKENDAIVTSPYTNFKVKNKSTLYIAIYIILLILIVLAIFWSINQITIDKKSAYIVSYRK